MRNFNVSVFAQNVFRVSGSFQDARPVAEKLVRAFSANPCEFPGLDAIGEAERVVNGAIMHYLMNRLNRLSGDEVDFAGLYDGASRFTPSEFDSLARAGAFLAMVHEEDESLNKIEAPAIHVYVNLNEGHTVLLVNVNHLG